MEESIRAFDKAMKRYNLAYDEAVRSNPDDSDLAFACDSVRRQYLSQAIETAENLQDCNRISFALIVGDGDEERNLVLKSELANKKAKLMSVG